MNALHLFAGAKAAGNPASGDIAYVEVTPDIARAWLKLHNTHNRPVSKNAVARYAADMVAGRWRHPTGEPLIFDSYNRLQQGQHRLHAVVQSGVTITFLVVRGADPGDFAVIDTGLKRSAGNAIAMKGGRSANSCATIVRNAILLRDHRDRIWSGGGGEADVTQQAVVEFYDRHADVVQEAQAQARALRHAARVPEAQFGAVAVNVMLASPFTRQWDDFYKRALTGDMLPVDHPVFALRRWAMGRQSSTTGGGQTQQSKVALIVKAWNAYVLDKPIKQLYWRREEIPMPAPLPSIY